MRHSEVAFCLLAASLSSKQACLRAGLPACRALVVMGCAVGWVAPCMHACAARRCLHAWHGSPPPRLSASTTGFLTPGPLAEPWRGLHVPGVPWVFVRLRTPRNVQKQAQPCAQGHRQSTLHTTKHQGEGHKGEANQPATQLQRGANLLSQAPPPPWEHWHIGTLAHWHQSLLACRSLLSVPPCQIIQAATSAGRQAANKQTNTPLIGQCGVSKARSAKLKKPKERPTACQHYGQVRSLAVRSQIDRQTQVLASQPASQPASKPDGKWELAG